ncbi:MAG TPA: hypothetical protein VD995_13285 [Azospirillum sp.]|nr:hypothetical protein [Azospirillum sp.]
MRNGSNRADTAVSAHASSGGGYSGAACGAGAGGAFPCWTADAAPVAAPVPAFAPAAPTRTASSPPGSERFLDPWR